MQIFLTNPDFIYSATSLDKQMCWKQTLKAKQLLSTLRYSQCPNNWRATNMWIKQSYKNHPASLMWVGYEELLAHYYNCLLWHCKNVHKIRTTNVFIPSKYTIINKSCGLIFESMELTCGYFVHRNCENGKLPFWYDGEGLYLSHQAALIEKDRSFYLSKFPAADGFNGGNYVYPVAENNIVRL